MGSVWGYIGYGAIPPVLKNQMETKAGTSMETGLDTIWLSTLYSLLWIRR